MPPTDSLDPQRSNPPSKPTSSPVAKQSRNDQPHTREEITTMIIKEIDKLSSAGFGKYPIRELVKHAEQFGSYLEKNQLKTNQVRKFLDAVNRIKAALPEDGDFSEIETDIVLLKPKLAYAAARQSSVQALSQVMSAAIDRVHSIEDFHRLVQFLESTIAYHKAAGGRD